MDTNRSLINPNFEGYKLDPLDQDKHVSTFRLHRKVTQSTVSASSRARMHIPFEEMRSRISHNHLATGKAGQFLYVDEDLGINIIRMKGKEPTVSRICELARPIETNGASSSRQRQNEYPSAAAFDEKTWIASDGGGRLFVISVEGDYGEIVSSLELQTEDEPDAACPFSICALRCNGSSAEILVSATVISAPSSSPQRKTPLFAIHCVSLEFGGSGGSSDTIRFMKPQWSLYGNDLPLHTEYSAHHSLFLILASEQYYHIKQDAPQKQPDSQSSDTPAALGSQNTLPYSWAQTNDSLTIAFLLPSSTSTADINIKFGVKALTVSITAENSTNSESEVQIIIPQYSSKELWGEIKTSESLWTWDKQDSQSYGLLSLHLEKAHEGTRWPQVFVDDFKEVPESLDPSEIANIRDLLDKYTSMPEPDNGLGRGVPSLAEGEMDEEADSNVGRLVVATWVTPSGITMGTSRDATPFTAVTTPLLSNSLLVPGGSQIVLKRSVDGLLFQSKLEGSDSKLPVWIHMNTFPALAFVLASKRDMRFAFHVGDKAVIALESGVSGNAYVYRRPEAKSLWAKQAILKASGGSAGSLLGVGGHHLENEEICVLCLCENELKLLTEIF